MAYYRLALFLFLANSFLPVQAQVSAELCGSLKNGYGPFDYRGNPNPLSPSDGSPLESKLRLVEGAHFTARVEQLIGAKSGGGSGPPGGDIDYTLRAFPNHHRALLSVMRYGEQKKSFKPVGLFYDVECYFERAIRFQPEDNIVRMIYTTFLTKNNRKPEAMQQLKVILQSAKDNAFTHQNVGLLYFDLGEHQLALTQAHKAIELGLNRPDLREKLQATGQWVEPATAVTGQTAAEPAERASAPAKP